MSETREELLRKLQEANKEGDNFKAQYYQSQLNALDQEQAADKALQEQASAVITGFSLPQDYDAYTGLEGMNDEITALITQVSEQLNAVYLAEREAQQATNREAMAALQAENDELKRQNDGLAGKAADVALDLARFKEDNYQLTMDLNDANSKRDAAVNAKEEAEAERDKLASENRSLKGQIDELEGVVRTLKKSPAPSGGLKLTSTLKLETDEERKARLEKQRLEVINRNLAEKYNLSPLKMPDEPTNEETVTPEALDAAFQSVEEQPAVVRAYEGGSGVQAPSEPLETAGDAEAGVTLDSLHKRLQVVEEWKKLFESQRSANGNEPVIAML
jgi:chromosome segregation ATPase